MWKLRKCTRMRIDEFFDPVDFDPADFDVGPLGGPPLFLVIKPTRKLKKRKKKSNQSTRTHLLRLGIQIPSPHLLELLNILDSLDYLDRLFKGV